MVKREELKIIIKNWTLLITAILISVTTLRDSSVPMEISLIWHTILYGLPAFSIFVLLRESNTKD